MSFLLEPGYYEDGSFGIRLENVVLVVPVKPKVGLKTVNQAKWTFRTCSRLNILLSIYTY